MVVSGSLMYVALFRLCFKSRIVEQKISAQGNCVLLIVTPCVECVVYCVFNRYAIL
jgi:hypothetical protein